MGCIPELELINNLNRVNITRRDLANTLNRNYSTVVSWLNGYTRMPDNYREWIYRLIEQKKANNNLSDLYAYHND